MGNEDNSMEVTIFTFIGVLAFTHWFVFDLLERLEGRK
jgi:hypothetical protein